MLLDVAYGINIMHQVNIQYQLLCVVCNLTLRCGYWLVRPARLDIPEFENLWRTSAVSQAIQCTVMQAIILCHVF